MTDVLIETWPGRPFACLSRTVSIPDMPATMGAVLGSVAAAFARAGAPMEGPAWCHYTAVAGTTIGVDEGCGARPQDWDALRAAGPSIGETSSGRSTRRSRPPCAPVLSPVQLSR